MTYSILNLINLSDDLKETVAVAEEALADEPEINGIKSLNFRSSSFGKI